MTVTCGFFNGSDRAANATDVCSIFDGLISDGIYDTIGTAFAVTAAGGNFLNLGPGRAWFNHTWTKNDATVVYEAPAAELLLHRWDRMVLEVDHSDAVRANRIFIMTGTPSSTPSLPSLSAGPLKFQYSLAKIYRAAGSTSIAQIDITPEQGTVATPFVNALVEKFDIAAILMQYSDRANELIDDLEAAYLVVQQTGIPLHKNNHFIGGSDSLPPASIGALPYDVVSSNLLINECFDHWPDGTTFVNPVNSKYIADGWMTGFNTADGGTYPTLTISKLEYLPHQYPSRNFFKFSTNGAGSSLGANSLYVIRQKIEQGTRLYAGYGNKITVSFLAYTTIPGKKIGVRLVQRYGTGGSPSASEVIAGAFFTLSGNPTVFSHTFTLNTKAGKTFGTNPDDMIDVDFVYMWGESQASNVGADAAETFVGSGDVYTVWAQANRGDAALPLVPRPFHIGLVLCQRYYEKSYDNAVVPGTANNGTGIWFTNVLGNAVPNGQRWQLGKHPVFKVRKRIAPTITLYEYGGALGQWLIGNASRASSAGADESGFYVANYTGETITPTAGEAFGHWVADARLY